MALQFLGSDPVWHDEYRCLECNAEFSIRDDKAYEASKEAIEMEILDPRFCPYCGKE